MNRRQFTATLAGLFALHRTARAAPASPVKVEKIEKLVLKPEEWMKRLTPAQYAILRQEGTERAGSSSLDREKRKGTFACAGCDLPLFDSDMKYDSGTGWPSFRAFIPGHLGTRTDFKIIVPRTEYHCIRCDGHQGHVFDDGPPPSGKRYCNNGLALKFIPA